MLGDGGSPSKGSETLGLGKHVHPSAGTLGSSLGQQCSLLCWGQHWDRWAK